MLFLTLALKLILPVISRVGGLLMLVNWYLMCVNGHSKRYRATGSHRVTGPESTAWLLLLTGTVGGKTSANNRASNVIAWPCETCGVHGRELGELHVWKGCKLAKCLKYPQPRAITLQKDYSVWKDLLIKFRSGYYCFVIKNKLLNIKLFSQFNIHVVMPRFFGLGKWYLRVSQWEITSPWSRKS